ncbi:hypothetical protein DFH28DRAFT_907944, partial [Melampsora americana]
LISVPRPHVDPAVIARLRPTPPVVRNIRREVILPARMKKLSAISTISAHPPISTLCVINSPEKKKTEASEAKENSPEKKKTEPTEEKKTTQKNLPEAKPVIVANPKRQSIFSSKCKGEPSGKRALQVSHEPIIGADSSRNYQASTVGSRSSGRRVTVEQGSLKGKRNVYSTGFQSTSISSRRSVDVTRTSRGQPFQTNIDHKRSASVKTPNLSKNLDSSDESINK